ncbi:hypothetical protein VCR15J2_460068 [Vibrio coralliirubri]|nr:hypothetical protein VCR15J2_460068 [Vibrio coralliirubri]
MVGYLVTHPDHLFRIQRLNMPEIPQNLPLELPAQTRLPYLKS